MSADRADAGNGKKSNAFRCLCDVQPTVLSPISDEASRHFNIFPPLLAQHNAMFQPHSEWTWGK